MLPPCYQPPNIGFLTKYAIAIIACKSPNNIYRNLCVGKINRVVRNIQVTKLNAKVAHTRESSNAKCKIKD